MRILITEQPSDNGYIGSLVDTYQSKGHEVICGETNFFNSNVIPDILHIHWPERIHNWYFQPDTRIQEKTRILTDRFEWYRSHNTKIIHTIHNLRPHDKKNNDSDSDIFNLIISYSDILIHHCEKSVQLLQETYPSAKNKHHIICPHGDYLCHYKKMNKEAARRIHQIADDKLVVLSFGHQRPYKGESFILDAFSRFNETNKFLFTAGKFYFPSSNVFNRSFYKARNYFRQNLKSRDRKYCYRSVSINEIPSIFTSADIVFLGQSKALNSGVLAMAATYQVPVVCPDVGCFSEAVQDWTHELFTPNKVDEAAVALEKMTDRLRTHDDALLDNAAWLQKNSWSSHVNTILKTITQISASS